MKIMLMSVLYGTSVAFSTPVTGETLTLSSGVNWVSVTCADCDIVMGGDTYILNKFRVYENVAWSYL